MELNRNRRTKPSSFATAASEDRISLLNKKLGSEIEVKTIDLMDGETASGTRVVIKIPMTLPGT